MSAERAPLLRSIQLVRTIRPMRLVLAVAFALSLLVPACGSSSSGGTTGAAQEGCTPGKTEACACPAGATGAQTCDEAGTAFGACDCGTGGSGGSGGGGGSGGSDGAACVPPGNDCSGGQQCCPSGGKVYVCGHDASCGPM